MKVTKFRDEIVKSVGLAVAGLPDMPSVDFKPDYVSWQTKTQEEYEEYQAELGQIAKQIEVSANLAAEQVFYELQDPVETQLGLVHYLYLYAPITNKVYQKYGVSEVALVVDKLSDLKKLLEETKAKFEYSNKPQAELLSIDVERILIQIRQFHLSKEIVNRNKPLSAAEQVAQLESEITKLKQLQIELDKEKVAKLQLMADFQNYRKRIEKERESFGLVANMALVSEILDVLDDLKRTLDDDTKDLDRCTQMLGIVRDKLLATVGRVGLEEVVVNIGDSFDAKKMEAIGTVAVSEVDDHNKVVTVAQPGYRYTGKDQLMRVAKVIVGKKEVTR